jgi:hypothetical protein
MKIIKEVVHKRFPNIRYVWDQLFLYFLFRLWSRSQSAKKILRIYSSKIFNYSCFDWFRRQIICSKSHRISPKPFFRVPVWLRSGWIFILLISVLVTEIRSSPIPSYEDLSLILLLIIDSFWILLIIEIKKETIETATLIYSKSLEILYQKFQARLFIIQ